MPGYDAYAAASVRLGRRYPLRGWWAEGISGFCAFWPFPSKRIEVDGKGLPPILMVNNDRDPLTPLSTRTKRARSGAVVTRPPPAQSIVGEIVVQSSSSE